MTQSGGVLYFVVGDRDRGPWSYTWRIFARGTSFYVKPRSRNFSAMKISLHGPDSRTHVGPPGNKVTIIDGKLPDGVAVRRSPQWPDSGWFPGRRVTSGVVHVLRLRFPWTLFGSDCPSAEFPGRIPKDTQGAVTPPPSPLRAIDLDLFVSNREPYWPNESQAREDNACLGPLVNEAGQTLTAVSTSRSPYTVKAPPDLTLPTPALHDRLRGIGAAPDPSGFVWFCEQWLSREVMDSASR
jgi:hypothetical protein